MLKKYFKNKCSNQFIGQHTGVNIKSQYDACLKRVNIQDKVFKIVSDQARNVKKAFSKTFECVDIVQITQELLNRQRKVDLIARRKEAKKNKELISEEVAVSELTNEIAESNTVYPSIIRRRSLKREDVLIELEDDECSDEITTTVSEHFGSRSGSQQDNFILALDNSMNDAVSEEEGGTIDDECPYEAELRQIDEDLDKFVGSNKIF